MFVLASGWEVATAIGTILGAAATAAAVIAALLIGAKDRRAADAALRRQIEAAERARKREHELDLLLSLSKQVAVRASLRGTREATEAEAVGLGILQALP